MSYLKALLLFFVLVLLGLYLTNKEVGAGLDALGNEDHAVAEFRHTYQQYMHTKAMQSKLKFSRSWISRNHLDMQHGEVTSEIWLRMQQLAKSLGVHCLSTRNGNVSATSTVGDEIRWDIYGEKRKLLTFVDHLQQFSADFRLHSISLHPCKPHQFPEQHSYCLNLQGHLYDASANMQT